MSLKEAIAKYTLEKGFNSKMIERKITVDDIEKYIIEYARKKLNNKDGAISDEEIFGQVVHYIEDAYKEKEAKPKVETEDVKVIVPEQPKEEHHLEQLSLFDTL